MKMYDCIVVGGGSSGVIAAIAAKRNGLNVLLVEKSAVLGGSNVGALVGPLMSFHAGDKQVVGGIASEIVTKLTKHHYSLGHINDPLGFCSTITPVDDEALKNLYFEYIDNEQIDLLLHSFVSDCFIEDNKLLGIEIVNKSGKTRYNAKIFIDASGDGDLAAYAKIPFILGREKDNLCQPMSMLFTVGNVNLNEVKDYIRNNPNEFVLRDNFDYRYIGVSGFFGKIKEAKQKDDFAINRDRVLFFEGVRKNEVTVNMTRVLGYNPLDAESVSKAEIEGRKQVDQAFKFLVKYVPGFKDSYIVKTAQQIGIRESRHIVGRYTLGVDDILNGRKFDSSIAVGSFPIDIHSPTNSGLELYEIPKNNSYEIPVEVMIPQSIDGLIITGRAISATHEASASARVSPTCMALGQAAGSLAALSVINNVRVSEVNINQLQQLLTKQGQVIKK